MKAHRLPRRDVKCLTDAGRRALDELRFTRPGPARRAELKAVLGWKRTCEETVALAVELIEKGMLPSAVAARLDVDVRYLGGLLKDARAGIVPLKPSVDAVESATKVQTPSTESSKGPLRPPVAEFHSFAELDAWLEGAA